jgi:hypothetical protein
MNARSSVLRLRSRRALRAFTLVELMVSLVAGLLVTIAVVGLARTATTTFYEEARLMTVETTTRTASERLRQDLSRTAFMGTGNIVLAKEDSTSVPFGQKVARRFADPTPSRYTATTNLQGIRIYVGGSLALFPPRPYAPAQGPQSLSTANNVAPDVLELTGNYTTDDSYRGRATNAGSIVTLNVNSQTPGVPEDPAVGRLLAGPNPDLALHNAFQPGTIPPAIAPPFMARVVDTRGCQHYVVISTVVGTTLNGGQATINLAPPTAGGDPILNVKDTQNHVCGINDGEEVTISPLQTVRWYIGRTATALEADPAVEAPGNKFDLYREILDANGNTVPAPGGPQVVAEYAVDFKLGVTVDDDSVGVLPPANLKVFDMDLSGPLITTWTQAATLTSPANPAPQRVRSVRFRLATRASLPDREVGLSIDPANPQYLTRYCTAPPLGACTKFARVRTIMSEVALPNQAGMSY